MTRHIDADALMKKLEESQPHNWTNTEAEVQAEVDWDYFEHMIENAPIIDAVEVVRCKDCKKAETEDCSHSYWDDDWGMFRVGYKGDDWYCADGERRTE